MSDSPVDDEQVGGDIEQVDARSGGPGDRVDVAAIELWFVERGVPHFVERKTDGSVLDAWTRALPLLVVAYLLLGLQALNLAGWTVGENLAAAGVIVAVLVATWAASNRLRGVPTFARPTDIDAPELVLFLIGPALPVLLFGQFVDAVETILLAGTILAFIYVWSAYGLGPLLRWAARRAVRQIEGLGSLVARALPLLLLFNAFLFINAEVWEVAGTLHGIAFWIAIATFLLLAAVFAVTRVPKVIRSLNAFEGWDDVRTHLVDTPAAAIELPDAWHGHDRLRLRQRFNIGLVVVFGQLLQVVLVAASIVAFFVGFGFVAISLETAAGWTQLEDTTVWFDVVLGDRRLVLSDPLLRVSTFLGAFSGMYFTVVLTTDATYRDEFADDVGPEIREALAVRTAYRVARGSHPASAVTATPNSTDRDNGVA